MSPPGGLRHHESFQNRQIDWQPPWIRHDMNGTDCPTFLCERFCNGRETRRIRLREQLDLPVHFSRPDCPGKPTHHGQFRSPGSRKFFQPAC